LLDQKILEMESGGKKGGGFAAGFGEERMEFGEKRV
jgi:hypothetical protein